MKFADRLEDARQAAGMTQQEIGDLVGVSRQTVNAWLQGGAPPVPLFQDAILSAIGASDQGGPVGPIRVERTVGGWHLVDSRGKPAEPAVITASAPIYPTKAAAEAQAGALSRKTGVCSPT